MQRSAHPTGATRTLALLVVDDPALKRKFAELYRECRNSEHEEFTTGTLAMPAPGKEEGYAETLQTVIRSGNYLVDHFEETPLPIFVFAIDDHGGATFIPRSGVPFWRRGRRWGPDDTAAVRRGYGQRVARGSRRAGLAHDSHAGLRLSARAVGCGDQSPSRT